MLSIDLIHLLKCWTKTLDCINHVIYTPEYMTNQYLPFVSSIDKNAKSGPVFWACFSSLLSPLTRSSQSNKLYVHRKDLCVSRKPQRYRGAVLYNSLGNTFQQRQSVTSFKYKAFKHFMWSRYIQVFMLHLYI